MLSTALVALAISASVSGFEHCDRALAEDTSGRAAATCVRTTAEANGRWADAVAWLESALARHPQSGWLTLQLAETSEQLNSPKVLELYAAALERFASAPDEAGEVEARIRFGVALYDAGRSEDAWRQVSLLDGATKGSRDTTLRARALVYEAWLAHQTGQRLGRALRALNEAESLVFPAGPYPIRLRVLFGLGNVSLELGRYDAALSHYSRVIELARENGDQGSMALGSSNVLNARRKQMELRPDPARLEEFIAEARRLAAIADASGNPLAQAFAHRALGDLLASQAATREAAGPDYESALKHARVSGDRNETATCLWALGRFLADHQPAEAQRLIDEALQMAARSGSSAVMAYAWRQQMRLAWRRLPPDRALAESLRALDAIETLRTLQDVDLARASVFATWTLDYYWLIGRLLEGPSPTRERVAQAFNVSERMRARVLLDTLQRQRLASGTAAIDDRRRGILQAISDVQARLLNPELDGSARQALVRELERLERDEADARARSAPADASYVSARDLVTLDAVERALGPDAAMLSFTIGVGRNFYGESEGGGRVLVVAASGTRVIDVLDRNQLAPVVPVLRDLVEHGGPQADPPAVAMYQHLLGAALESLPPGVTRLVVIADGALNHLPFAALRPSADAPPVGVTHEIAVVPSATFWRDLRQRQSSFKAGRALVLADPELPNADERKTWALERDWSLQTLELGQLSQARREGRAVVSRVAGGSRLLAGVVATEQALKTLSADFTILHFATHAVVDEVYPERSAVVLAGGGGEDGLLQSREIVELPLAERVVVLSACRTAGGAVLGGEGVVGLSRAFFEAGARTVVGTLWAIRDDHAARFTEAFYASLAEGRSVGSALREARRRSIAAGLPAAAWASFVVIGDDTVIPVPRRPRSLSPALAGSLAAIAVILGLLWRHRQRRRYLDAPTVER